MYFWDSNIFIELMSFSTNFLMVHILPSNFRDKKKPRHLMTSNMMASHTCGFPWGIWVFVIIIFFCLLLAGFIQFK